MGNFILSRSIPLFYLHFSWAVEVAIVFSTTFPVSVWIVLILVVDGRRGYSSGKRPLSLWDLCLWKLVLVFGKGSLGSFALGDVLRAHFSAL